MSSTTTSATTFDFLQGQQFMSLKTFRKSGEAIPTPVWFALEGDRIYVVTQASSGKVKRIRNNAQVEITPCKANGDLLGQDYRPAQAQVISLDDARAKPANAALAKKYGWQLRMFAIMWAIRRKPHVFLEITPA